MQKIGKEAFYRCSTLPSTVIEIGGYAFRDCNKLSEVALNEGLKKIGQFAFWYCASLSTVTLPSTVTEVDNAAFCCCNNLTEVVVHGVPRVMGKNAFLNCTSLVRFTFPTISTRLDNLIQTGLWNEINNRVGKVRGVVERSGGDLFASAQTMDRGRN